MARSGRTGYSCGVECFSCAPAGGGVEEAGARCSVETLVREWSVATIARLAGVELLPAMRRSFEWACGMLAFLYGDGVVEVRRGVRTVRVMARVSTTRASTLFAAAARYLVFASPGSQGSVFCSHGITRIDMRFVVPLNLELLRGLGLSHVEKGKQGIRRDLLACLEDEEAAYHVAAGLIDSEGSISKTAWRIYVGMKDYELLDRLSKVLRSKGVDVKDLRLRRNKVAVMEIKGGQELRPAISVLVNPVKRILAARMLVKRSVLGRKRYHVAVENVRTIVGRFEEPVSSKECIHCARTVLEEARALASAGNPAEKDTSSPPSLSTSHPTFHGITVAA